MTQTMGGVMIDCAYELIDDIGKSVSLRKVTTGAYDPATGQSSNTNADERVRAMVLNYKDREKDGSKIQFGDRKIVIAAKDATTPKIDDLIIDGSATYRLIDLQIVEENAASVIYVCQGREQ